MRRFFRRLISLVQRGRSEREMAEEFDSHLRLHVEDNLRNGMSRAEAVRLARLKFGSVEASKEDYRETLGFPLIEATWQDIRFGLRMLAKSQVWTTVVCLTLVLGIGLTTAVFSIVYSVLLQPLPYPEPDRLVEFWTTFTTRGTRFNVIAGNWKDWRTQTHSYVDIALVRSVGNLNLTGDGPPERIQGARITGNLLTVLGAHPALGRWHTEEEDQRNARVVVLSDGIWRSHFAADANIVGRKVRLNAESYEVIGVMPPEFHFPRRDFEMWTPLFVSAGELQDRSGGDYSAVGRLRPEITIQAAQQEMTALMLRWEKEYPGSNQHLGAVVDPYLESWLRNTRTPLYTLLGAAGCLLLIGCMNLGVLLIGRASARAREMAVRAALGAASHRLRSQILMELLPVSLIGALGGIACAYGLLAFASAYFPESLPRAESIGMHLPVLACSIGLSLATVLGAALLPATWAAKFDLAGTLRQDTRSGSTGGRARNALVTAQVASALVLVIGGGLLGRSLTEVLRVNPGFSTGGVLSLHLAVTRARYVEPAQVSAYEQRLVDAIAAIPGVESAAFTNRLPFTGTNQTNPLTFEGMDGNINTETRSISPRYFDAMRVALVAGREFAAGDKEDSPRVVIVDDAFVKQVFGSSNPIGRRVRLGFGGSPWISIVGVVGHIRHTSPEADSPPQVYFPIAQRTQDRGALVVRTQGDPAAMTKAVTASIGRVDPEQPVFDVRTMEEWTNRVLASRTLLATLVTSFSAAALLLACLGLYGVVSYTASLRTREFGIRMAMGATSGNVQRSVLGHASRLTLTGAAVGLLLAWPAGMLMRSLLFGVTPADWVSIAGAVGILLVVAIAASLIPARRAARTDPMTVLRGD